MLPSASMGDPSGPGVFEPCHGSAPDIAGQDKANPLVGRKWKQALFVFFLLLLLACFLEYVVSRLVSRTRNL